MQPITSKHILPEVSAKNIKIMNGNLMYGKSKKKSFTQNVLGNMERKILKAMIIVSQNLLINVKKLGRFSEIIFWIMNLLTMVFFSVT